MKTTIILSLILFQSSAVTFGQNNAKVFYVESWKKGEVIIREEKVTVELNKDNLDYKRTIYNSANKPRYILWIRPAQLSKELRYLYESWWVDLCEFRKPNRKPKYAKDCKLLVVEGRGTGGDNFPKEDEIGWLYPLEKPELFKDGVMAYPILAKRVVKVDGFYCVIQVKDYKMSKTNPKAVDSLKVEIELTNHYNAPKSTAASSLNQLVSRL